MPLPASKDGFTTAHAYQAVTALFTRTGTYAAAAISGLGLHVESSFSIRKTSRGDFIYTDESGKERVIALTTEHNGGPVITAIGSEQMPVLA